LKQVLLIDADPVLRRSTALMFLQLGVVPILVADIPGGFALLDAEPSISCIVLDLALPDLRGADLRTVAPDIPILALQEHHLPDESGKHSTLWFDGLLTRPFTLAQLRDSLTAILADYGSIRHHVAP
jgi:DNA-binding response OmpR family regulator